MTTIPTIEIDYEQPCRKCGKPGATKSGLCLSCVSKQIIKKLKEKKA